MILFRPWEAAPCNALLSEWGHYLDAQRGPRMVLWYGLFLAGVPVGVAVSASPRGATCAGRPWREVVECARLCSHPDHGDMTRVLLRCWRKVAAQHWADSYNKTVTTLAAYSDSSRHPGHIYRTDGWQVYDERVRGSGGTAGSAQRVAVKKLWVWPLGEPVHPRQAAIPAVVLDPFAGSGTVGVVALREGRRLLGLELSEKYVAMARRRIAGPLFAQGEAAP